MPIYTNAVAGMAQQMNTANTARVTRDEQELRDYVDNVVRNTRVVNPVGTDDAVDAVRYARDVRPNGGFTVRGAEHPVTTNAAIQWEVPTPVHRMVSREFQYMLSAIAYLLFKKGGIDPGEYQTMTQLNELSFDELLAYIIQVADSPRE